MEKVKHSPLNAFLGEIFVDCPSCHMSYTVPETTIKFTCSNSECEREILV